jgi:hypothetical protein
MQGFMRLASFTQDYPLFQGATLQMKKLVAPADELSTSATNPQVSHKRNRDIEKLENAVVKGRAIAQCRYWVAKAPLRASVENDWKRRGNWYDTLLDRTSAPLRDMVLETRDLLRCVLPAGPDLQLMKMVQFRRPEM